MCFVSCFRFFVCFVLFWFVSSRSSCNVVQGVSQLFQFVLSCPFLVVSLVSRCSKLCWVVDGCVTPFSIVLGCCRCFKKVSVAF